MNKIEFFGYATSCELNPVMELIDGKQYKCPKGNVYVCKWQIQYAYYSEDEEEKPKPHYNKEYRLVAVRDFDIYATSTEKARWEELPNTIDEGMEIIRLSDLKKMEMRRDELVKSTRDSLEKLQREIDKKMQLLQTLQGPDWEKVVKESFM